jgi:hypothetical protein
MNGNWIWIVIPISAIFAGVARTWIRARHGYSLDPPRRGRHSQDGPDELRTLKESLAARDVTIAKLEERVRVLERIATDKASALRDEIDRLRD